MSDKSSTGVEQQTLGGRPVTKVVNQKRTDRYDVDIGRADNGESDMSNTPVGEPGWLGNPFAMSDGWSREEAVERFREAFRQRLREDEEFRAAVDDLHGQILACYCKPKACHGDVIVEYLRGDLRVE